MRCLVTIHRYSVCTPPTFTTSTQNKLTFLSNLHRVFLCNISLAVRTTSFQSSLLTKQFRYFQYHVLNSQNKAVKGRGRIKTCLARGVHQTALNRDCIELVLFLNVFSSNLIRYTALQITVKSEVSIKVADCIYDHISNRHGCEVLVRISSSWFFSP